MLCSARSLSDAAFANAASPTRTGTICEGPGLGRELNFFEYTWGIKALTPREYPIQQNDA